MFLLLKLVRRLKGVGAAGGVPTLAASFCATIKIESIRKKEKKHFLSFQSCTFQPFIICLLNLRELFANSRKIPLLTS
jgi:hypothetical protein